MPDLQKHGTGNFLINSVNTLNQTNLEATSRRKSSEDAHIHMSEKAPVDLIHTKCYGPSIPFLMHTRAKPDSAGKTGRTQSRANRKNAADGPFGKTQCIRFQHSLKGKLGSGCLLSSHPQKPETGPPKRIRCGLHIF
jgi:hypothetical protein